MSNLFVSKSTKHQTIIDILVFVLMLFFTNSDIRLSSRILYWGVMIGVPVLVFLLSYKRHNNIIFDSFLLWVVVFFVWCLISTLYSIHWGNSINLIKTLALSIISLACISWSIRSKEELISIIKTYVCATIFNAIWLTFVIDWSTFGQMRLNVENVGDNWNANAIGLMMIWGVILSCYLAKTLKQRKYYLAILLFVPLIIYSGSRKVWLSAIVIILMMIYINNQKRLFKGCIIAAIAIVVIYNLMFNIEFFYNAGGARLEQLINGLLGKDVYDESSELRLKYIEMGMEWFKERPLFGYGADAFRTLLKNSRFGIDTYSHNNYVELLVNLGVVGFVAYYCMYVSLLSKLFKSIKNSMGAKKEQGIIWFVMLIIILVLHYGAVFYTSLSEFLLLLFVYKYYQLNRSST